MIKQLASILLGRGTDRPSPSMDKIHDFMDRHLADIEAAVEPAPESKPRTSFDAGLPIHEVSMANLKAKQRLQAVSRAVPLMWNMHQGSKMYADDYTPSATEASKAFLADLERMAKSMGARDIRYIEVPRNAIFKGKRLPAKYAIIFTVEMDKNPIDTSPSWDSQREVMRGYKDMAAISKRLSNHLRAHGFAAYPGMALGGITDYVYLAELAGLGAIGYHGLLISPGEGARLRINTIYTNIENLPIQAPEDNEHLWIRDFCAMCKKCVRSCPVDAIYDHPEPRGDGGYQTIDHATCRDYFTRNYGCAVCLKVCPFSQVGYDNVHDLFKGNPHAPVFNIIPLEEIRIAKGSTL
ncbi:MAG: 4Fe-4S dicluster domain-containing protein [Chloroflexota bacterium]